MTGGGAAPWSLSGTQGSEEVVATNERPRMVSFAQGNSDQYGPPANELVEVFAPEGSIYEVKSLGFEFTATGTTGDEHIINVRSGASLVGGYAPGYNPETLEASAPSDEKLNRNHGETSSNATVQPSDPQIQRDMITDMFATDSQPIRLKYVNPAIPYGNNRRSYSVVAREVKY